MVVHLGVLRYMRKQVGANAAVVSLALLFDAIVLIAFTVMKLRTDPAIVVYAAVAITAVFIFQRFYLARWFAPQSDPDHAG